MGKTDHYYVWSMDNSDRNMLFLKTRFSQFNHWNDGSVYYVGSTTIKSLVPEITYFLIAGNLDK